MYLLSVAPYILWVCRARPIRIRKFCAQAAAAACCCWQRQTLLLVLLPHTFISMRVYNAAYQQPYGFAETHRKLVQLETATYKAVTLQAGHSGPVTAKTGLNQSLTLKFAFMKVLVAGPAQLY